MFRDREDAAYQLAATLRDYEFKNPLVLAIPRGGIVTGAVLAREIGAELDVVLSRKLRAPDQPELAIGAISESGEVYLNEGAAEAAGVTDEYFHREKEHQLSVIASRKESVRRVRPEAPMKGRSVIITDDGIATGSTMMAAVQTVRSHEPAELIVAVPVAPADRIAAFEQHGEKVVCLLKARHFWAVGQFYEVFPTIDDEQVLEILKEFAPQTA
ncbi:MAG: phosphoribosyltransferase family protein [Pirellulales bacterium]